MSQELNVTVSQLPANFCPVDFASGFQEAMGFVHVTFPGTLNTINYGSVTPLPEDRNKPWYRTETTGFPDRWYGFYNGYWVAKHPLPPGTGTIYYGTEASITTFDEGEAGAVTELSGPFWEKVSALDAKFPIGKGTLASGLVLAEAATGGEEKHVLSLLEMPRHRHQLEVRQKATNNPNQPTSYPIQDNDYQTAPILVTTRAEGGDDAITTTDNHNQAANNMPPYYTVLFIRRTARLLYRKP